jgi:probable HAF family extracellular repeat protein
MNRTLANYISLGIGLSAIGVAFPAQAAFFQGLGFLPGSSSFFSDASGVSADGSVVVGGGLIRADDVLDDSNIEAFRWTQATGMVGLGFLPGGIFDRSAAVGVSADGSVVVGFGNSANSQEAFRWTETTGMVGLGDLLGGSFSSVARAVSANGSIIVGIGNSASGEEAFRWTQGTGMVGLGDLPGGSFASSASGVSADGSVVVGSSRIFGTSGNAFGIEAFRWTEGTGMVGLGDLPEGSFFSIATGVSGDGSVVVGQGEGANGFEAFIWNSSQGMRSLQEVLTNDYGLNLTDWTLSEATAISADGLSIVGFGINPNGNGEAWIARLDGQTNPPNPSVPEPSSILGLGLFSLVGFLRKKRS